jgi:hypothetical protein
VFEESLRGRQKLCRKWIKVLNELVQKNNFFAALSVLRALKAKSVSRWVSRPVLFFGFFFFFLKKKFVFFRLKFSFALIPAPEMEQLANAERVLSSANCFAQSAERAARLDADVPFVPVFERGLEQVMHVVNAMADERNGLIMWRKRKQLWSVLKEIATAKQRACLFGFSRNDHAVQAFVEVVLSCLADIRSDCCEKSPRRAERSNRSKRLDTMKEREKKETFIFPLERVVLRSRARSNSSTNLGGGGGKRP